MSSLEMNSSESCGPVQHMLRYSQELTFRLKSSFKNDIKTHHNYSLFKGRDRNRKLQKDLYHSFPLTTMRKIFH